MSLEKEIRKILSKYLKNEDNLAHAEKLFVAKSVLVWVFENNKDQKAIKYYISEVEKYLKEEIVLYWEDGVIKIRKD